MTSFRFLLVFSFLTISFKAFLPQPIGLHQASHLAYDMQDDTEEEDEVLS